VYAVDVPALVDFYKKTFGLQQVGSFSGPGFQEIMLNFGKTEEAARAYDGSQIVVLTRRGSGVQEPAPHLIFRVPDIAKAVKVFVANGGTIDREPVVLPGAVYAFVKDPAGNLVEFLGTV
jgi:catechol 2,3-dioxygenase-like lactoylglutathione lyase family enzyme